MQPWLQGKGTNTTQGDPNLARSSFLPAGVGNPKPEHFTAFPHTGDINAPFGRERKPSTCHISINPPWCRCAGLWLTLTALLAPCTTGILPSLCCEKTGEVHPKWHHPHLEVITSIFLSWQPEFYHTLSVLPSDTELKGKTKQKQMQQISTCDVNCFFCLQSHFYHKLLHLPYGTASTLAPHSHFIPPSL